MAQKRPPDRPPLPFVSPQLATLVAAPPVGDDWLHEVKLDGFRILCRIDASQVTLFTRTGQDWTARFADVATAAAKLGLDGALLDGEVAVVLPDGKTSFQALQNHLYGESRGRLTYFVFDLLFLDGQDLRSAPLVERKAALARAIPKQPRAVVRFTDHVVGNGAEFFEKAATLGLEGIVSKKRDAPYRSGRGAVWLKSKALRRQELVVGGFTEPEGSRSGVGALLVGFSRDGGLSYAGKVGTGFTQKSALELRRRLEPLIVERSPFQSAVPGAGRQIRWVRPELVAEIAFAELTTDGKLRHPSFQGLREDKPAREVVQELPQSVPSQAPERAAPPLEKASKISDLDKKTSNKMDEKKSRKPSPVPSKNPSKSASKRATKPATTNPSARKSAIPSASTRPAPNQVAGVTRPAPNQVAGVTLTHPERLLEEKAGLTKRDLAEYYDQIAPHILPHLLGRPLSLVRCPEGMAGKCFFMKHAAFATPGLRRTTIQEKEEKGDYLIVDTRAGLVSLAQMSVLEIHTWNSVDRTLEMPDRVVFDFDPGPEAPWQDVVDGAMRTKERVEQIGCTAFVKTTGGKGLHVVVPLRPDASWDECRLFSQLVSESIVASEPARFTTAMRKAGRERKVLIDYFRNTRGATSVSVFSTRARAGLPVSVPIAWSEVAGFRPERPFTMESTLRRLGAAPDPWRDYEASRVDLKAAIAQAPTPRSAKTKPLARK